MRPLVFALSAAAAISLNACRSTSQAAVLQEQLREAQSKEQFHRRFKRFQVVENSLAGLTKLDFIPASRSLLLYSSEGVRLELTLGERWAVATNNIYRTESRYRLMDSSGRLLAGAESTLAIQDLPVENTRTIRVLVDPSTHTFLLAEQQSWATFRYIVVRPSSDAAFTTESIPRAWSVSYLDIPEPASIYPAEGIPDLLGIRNGRIFLRQDGKIYALPFEILNEHSDLAYPIG